MRLKIDSRKRHRRCRGAIITELVVAATLLVTAISILGALAVRTGRLWQDTRHYQLATQELVNQLERLTALDDESREATLAELIVTPAVGESLPGATLTASEISDADGKRILLTIQWDRPSRTKGLSMVGWVSGTAEEDSP